MCCCASGCWVDAVALTLVRRAREGSRVSSEGGVLLSASSSLSFLAEFSRRRSSVQGRGNMCQQLDLSAVTVLSVRLRKFTEG